MDDTLFGMSRFYQFSLLDATDRSKISSDQKPIPPFIFCEHSL